MTLLEAIARATVIAAGYLSLVWYYVFPAIQLVAGAVVILSFGIVAQAAAGLLWAPVGVLIGVLVVHEIDAKLAREKAP